MRVKKRHWNEIGCNVFVVINPLAVAKGDEVAKQRDGRGKERSGMFELF